MSRNNHKIKRVEKAEVYPKMVFDCIVGSARQLSKGGTRNLETALHKMVMNK